MMEFFAFLRLIGVGDASRWIWLILMSKPWQNPRRNDRNGFFSRS